MSATFPVVITFVLAQMLLVCVFAARSVLRAHRRVRHVQTRKVSELAPGPAEVFGRIRALAEPLMTAGGVPAVVIRTELETVYSNGGKTYRDPFAYDGVAAVPIELDDGSGTIAIDAEHLVPVAERLTTTVAPDDYAARFPELFGKMVKNTDLVEVRVHETFVPADIDAFAAGEAVASGEAIAGDDYRDARTKLRLRGSEEQPLLLSGWHEADVRKHLLHPAWLLSATAALGAAILGALWGVRAYIMHLAGLS